MYPIMADIGFDLAYQIDLALNSPKSPWMSKNRTLLNIQSDSLFMYLPIVEDGQVTGHFTTLSKSCVNFCVGVFRTRVKNIFFLFDFHWLKKSRQKCQNLDFKVKNFQIFFPSKYHFRFVIFFLITLFSKMMLNCWQLVWNNQCTISRWFSVGICKYKLGYKSHDHL